MKIWSQFAKELLWQQVLKLCNIYTFILVTWNFKIGKLRFLAKTYKILKNSLLIIVFCIWSHWNLQTKYVHFIMCLGRNISHSQNLCTGQYLNIILLQSTAYFHSPCQLATIFQTWISVRKMNDSKLVNDQKCT